MFIVIVEEEIIKHLIYYFRGYKIDLVTRVGQIWKRPKLKPVVAKRLDGACETFQSQLELSSHSYIMILLGFIAVMFNYLFAFQ